MSEAMRDYTVLYNTRSSLWRAHHSASRDVRDQHIGRVLDCAMVAALESVACRVGTQERAGLSEERFSVRRLRLFGGEELVDLHHKPGQRMEPIEPRVREHESKEHAAPFNAPGLALVPDAGIIEQRLVHAKQHSTHVLE